MGTSISFLQKAELLGRGEVAFPWVAGVRVARGFADLGYEEFSLLSSSKLVSLFTGQVSELKEEDRKHFFRVPTLQEMSEVLNQAHFDVISADFIDRRTWQLTIQDQNAGQYKFSDSNLLMTFLDALLKLVAKEVAPKPPGILRVEHF